MPIEAVFTQQQMDSQWGELPSGVFVLRATTPASDRNNVLGNWHGYHVIHIPSNDPVTAGLDAVQAGGVVAAAAHHGPAINQTMLALRFARHLSDCRASDPSPVRPCVTSASRPDGLPPIVVRIPHLIAVATLTGVTDQVIWEMMAECHTVTWLGGALPDQAWYESHLPDLLQLRSQLRSRQILTTDVGQRLTDLLTGRYLSIRFAYQHRELIDEVFATEQLEC
jgi:hypothetical protein